MKPTNKKLAVIEKATVPKPTKEETITALAMLKIEQLQNEREEAKKKREAILAELNQELLSFAELNFTTATKSQTIQTWEHGASVELRFSEESLPGWYKAKRREFGKITLISVPTLQEAKRQVRAAMDKRADPSERIGILLTDEKCRKALEQILKSFDSAK